MIRIKKEHSGKTMQKHAGMKKKKTKEPHTHKMKRSNYSQNRMLQTTKQAGKNHTNNLHSKKMSDYNNLVSYDLND